MKPADFERIIIKALFVNDTVRGKVLPALKTDWFFDIDDKFIIEKIIDFNGRFGQMPNVIEMKRLISDDTTLGIFEDAMSIPDDDVQTEFMLDEIQEYVRRRLVSNVCEMGHKAVQSPGAYNASLTDLMAEAETFTFDTNIGFDILNDPDRLYEDANTKEKIYNSGIKIINDMIGGGFHEKSLNLFMAPTNIGKTLIMCSLATNFLLNGHNVLYVTFEDPENKIAGRMAQNLFDITQKDYKAMSRDNFNLAFANLKKKLPGNRVIVKEYPEGTVNAVQLNALLKELKDKQNFVPDVMLVDYIGCMIPNGRPNPNLNTNTTLQLISLQVRALGMTHGIPIISGLQANRGGNGVAEISLNDVADSFASTTKADAIFGVTQTDEYKQQNVYCVKLLKTRYGNQRNDTFLLGVDIEKQRIYDVDNEAIQQGSVNIFDAPEASNRPRRNTPEPEEEYVYEEAPTPDEIDFM